MKKRYWILAGLAAICIATVMVQVNQAEEAQLPEPYIKFDGGQVIFADNIPQCH